MTCYGRKTDWGDLGYPELMVSINGSGWTDVEWNLDPDQTVSAYSSSIVVNQGDRIQVCARKASRQRVTVENDLDWISTTNVECYGLRFSQMTGSWHVEGDIRSLLSSNPESIIQYGNTEFADLFCNPDAGTYFDCQNLKLGEKGTVLGPGCFYQTFYGNARGTSGTRTPPQIPFETPAKYCFRMMFGFDSAMTQAPDVNLTSLEEGCLNQTFYYCQKMTYGPKAFCPSADFSSIPKKCFAQAFQNCSKMESVGVDLSSVETVDEYGMQSMFSQCAKLAGIGGIP